MWFQFLSENSHFAVNLFTSLAFFSVFWLYYDAWVDRKTFKEGLKILGFLLISLSFLAHATLIESTSFNVTFWGGNLGEKVTLILKNFGYLLLIAGLITDPLIAKPKLASITITSLAIPFLLSPILATIIAWLYLRRATIGLENHTKKVTFAFFALALYEFVKVPSLFVSSNNVDIFRLVSPFGPLWIISHLTLMLCATILIEWAFSYLLKRINTQLFIIFTTTTLCIFLLTTVSFTFLLLKNLSEETLVRLNTDVSVLSYALDAKKSEGLAQATILSQNSTVISAVTEKDRKTLAKTTEELLINKKLSSVVIIDDSGQVLARGEERDRVGDSLSGNSLIKRALIGESVSTITSQEAALAPQILVKSAVPVISNGKIVGATIVSLTLDNNFLDGIKNQTGLEVSIYGGEILSATTISDLHGTTRPIGIKNSDKNINNTVLIKGETSSEIISLLNTSYFASHHPLKDNDNSVIGMIMAGRPAASIFDTAGKTIELTFLITIVLMIISVFPSYYIAKYITSQIT